MTLSSLIILVGGLLCFLYGMYIMTNGLQGVAHRSLQRSLERLMKTPLRGLLLGAGFTAIIQSSSAVIVMLVGMVQAGMISFSQTIGVIMGAELGTTVTAWLLGVVGSTAGPAPFSYFQPQMLAFLSLIIGLLLHAPWFHKGRNWGKILLGFGVLWCGMQSMSNGVEPLVHQPGFMQLLTMFSHPWLSLGAGAVFTGIIQSSSAAIGLLQAMSLTGVITWQMALPLVLGMNIGTCGTAILASLGMGREAKRVAAVQVLMQLIGAAICMPLFSLSLKIQPSLWAQAANPLQIAWMHTLFNFAIVLGLFPWSKQLERVVMFLIPPTKTSSK